MKLLKKVISSILILLVLIYGLFLLMSSSNLNESEYYQVKTYSSPQSVVDSTLSVMTYNIGYLSGMTNNQSIKREFDLFDQNLQQSKQLIQKMEPDIIGFQEIDFTSARSFDVNQLDSLALAGGYTQVYQSINWDKKYVPFPYWPPSNHFGSILSGQAILSQFPILEGRTTILTPNEHSPAYYRAFYLDRLLQVAEIEFLGQNIIVMNVHLEAYDKATRLKQIRQVKETYERYASKQPVLLMGDFNSQVPAMSEEMDAIELLIESDWIASAVPFGKEPTNRTYSSERPAIMIDYIFYNENYFECLQASVANEAGQISDHLPVWGAFRLK